MYLWQTTKLGIQLRDSKLSDKELRLYFVIFAVAMLPRINLGVWDVPVVSKPYTWGYLAAFGLIALIGALKCFAAKGEHGINNFFERFVCLSVPLGIKLAVIEVVVKLVAVKAIFTLLGPERAYSWSAYEPLLEQEGVKNAALTLFAISSVISLLFLAVFFARMRTHLHHSGQAPHGI